MRAFLLLSFLAAALPCAAADLARGSQTYALHCAVCHGPAGQGGVPGAPKFNRGERLMQSDLALLESVRRGRNIMPAFAGVLRDREILDVIAYLRTLQR
ncbi:MAG: cytochrome c [Betaproteobacteria bacterium]|nr:cytochrome c [Betaproteobacteria bacterium]PWB61706.1 MAG: cytochrome c, class I [Betaproteobacteria bacterium]